MKKNAAKAAGNIPDIGCTIKMLPDDMALSAAAHAVDINPANHPIVSGVLGVLAQFLLPGVDAEDVLTPARLSVMTTKYWGPGGVKLTVGFLDNPPAEVRNRILAHMNAWSQYGNISFVASNISPQVRIARVPGQGHYSYLGTDILSIPANQPTMNLDSFARDTPESEYRRVVRHETGHCAGMPHEHMRRELIARLDVQKTLAYFAQTQGWSAQVTRQQVLTPIEETSLIATPQADQTSIMTYQLPGSITKDGRPILGGTDIDEMDKEFVGKIYPLPVAPPPPPVGIAVDLVAADFSASGMAKLQAAGVKRISIQV